jgi:hypothetical protein
MQRAELKTEEVKAKSRKERGWFTPGKTTLARVLKPGNFGCTHFILMVPPWSPKTLSLLQKSEA